MRNITGYSQRERESHIQGCRKWRSTGGTVISYCKTHGINRSTLDSWFQKYGNHLPAPESSESKSFIKISDGPKENRSVTHHSCALTVNVGSVAIELPSGNSEADLCRVLRALKEVL